MTRSLATLLFGAALLFAVPMPWRIGGAIALLYAAIGVLGGYTWFLQQLSFRGSFFLLLWALVMLALTPFFDPATSLSAGLLGIGVYCKANRQAYAGAALFFLLAVPVLLMGRYEAVAERFAIVAYWLLAAAVVSGIVEVYKERHAKI